MREYTSPSVVDVPGAARLTDVVFDRAGQHPGAVVMRRKTPPVRPEGGPPASAVWQDVTARQFRDEVATLAKGLIAAGIEPGERVALMSRTRYEWSLADYAIWTAGAVSVPVYETSSAEQVEWIMTDSGARAIIVETPVHLQAIGEVLGRLPEVSRVWLIEGGTATGGRGTDGQPLASLAGEGAGVTDGELTARRTAITAVDLATIIYTSGTTGRPKGCELTHGNLLSGVRNAVRGPLARIFQEPGASTLLFLPMAHSFAREIGVGTVEAGVVLGHSSADLTELLPNLATFQPTFILAVPRMFEKIYNSAEQQALASAVKAAIFRSATRTAIAWSETFGTHDTSGRGPGRLLRLRRELFDLLVYRKLRSALGGRAGWAISGGAPLGARLGHFFRGAGITVLEGYGLTETSAASTVNRPDRNKVGTVGQPLPGVSVRVADDGEVLISGPHVFHGYWHNDSASKEALTGDGWLRSGDLGELDDEGYLRVTGRKKELIVTAGGKNVSPAVLEDRIRAHPLVSQCLVVGDGKPYVACLITLDAEALGPWQARRGRRPSAGAAVLAGDPDLLAEVRAAVDDANKSVSRPEQIKRFRVLTTDFTEQSGYLTPSLKVRRNLVIKDFAADIEALYR